MLFSEQIICFSSIFHWSLGKTKMQQTIGRSLSSQARISSLLKKKRKSLGAAVTDFGSDLKMQDRHESVTHRRNMLLQNWGLPVLLTGEVVTCSAASLKYSFQFQPNVLIPMHVSIVSLPYFHLKIMIWEVSMKVHCHLQHTADLLLVVPPVCRKAAGEHRQNQRQCWQQHFIWWDPCISMPLMYL